MLSGSRKGRLVSHYLIRFRCRVWLYQVAFIAFFHSFPQSLFPSRDEWTSAQVLLCSLQSLDGKFTTENMFNFFMKTSSSLARGLAKRWVFFSKLTLTIICMIIVFDLMLSWRHKEVILKKWWEKTVIVWLVLLIKIDTSGILIAKSFSLYTPEC